MLSLLVPARLRSPRGYALVARAAPCFSILLPIELRPEAVHIHLLTRGPGGRPTGFFRDRLRNASRLEKIGIQLRAVRTFVDPFEQRGREDHCHRLWALTILDSVARWLSTGGLA